VASSPFIKQDYKGILDTPQPRRRLPYFSILVLGIAAISGGILFTALTADAGQDEKTFKVKEITNHSEAATDTRAAPPLPTVTVKKLTLPAATPPTSPDVQTAATLPATTQASITPPESEPPVTRRAANSGDLQPQPAATGSWRTTQVRPGDSLAKIFQRLDLSAAELHRIVSSGKTAAALKRIYPGQTLRFRIAPDNRVLELQLEKDQLHSLQILASEDGYTSHEIAREPERTLASASATINDSLFLAAQQAGLSNALTMELAGIFGWDIDFALDIRQGDHFNTLYEDLALDGKPIGHGDILAAEFVNQGKTYRAVRYTAPDGHSDYYTPEGKSMRKAFLRTPVAFARISSRFSLGRKHPILNRIRAHKGVDYAAPSGTPIKAAGDGKVVFAGRKGGYGNVIVLQHGNTYSTLYGHMSRFAKGIRSGTRIRQGQTIGYVGMTGLATGPHLHYEFRVNGVHRNPLTVSLPAAAPIAAKYRADFLSKTGDLLATLDQIDSSTRVASSTP